MPVVGAAAGATLRAPRKDPAGGAGRRRACSDGGGRGRPGGAGMAVEFTAYAAFERELVGDLIPFIDRATRCRPIANTAPSRVSRWVADSR